MTPKCATRPCASYYPALLLYTGHGSFLNQITWHQIYVRRAIADIIIHSLRGLQSSVIDALYGVIEESRTIIIRWSLPYVMCQKGA